METSKLLNNLAYKVRERAVQNVGKMLPTSEELAELAELARSLCSEGGVIDYQTYKNIGTAAPASLKRFFVSSYFLSFPRTDFGEISIQDLISFIQQTIDLELTAAELTKFSRGSVNSAYFELSESELGAFLYSQIRRLITNKIHFDLVRFYMSAVCRRFFFSLDNKHSGRISTRRLLQSPLLADFLEMKRVLENNIFDEEGNIRVAEDGSSAVQSIVFSWFDPDNVIDLYDDFLKLDKDKNGTLSIDELYAFSGTKNFSIQFTRVALQRIFEAHVCNEAGEMDFNGFVELVLAIDNPKSKESHNYLWKALNIDTSEMLTSKVITYFYNEVVISLEQLNYSCPKIEDVIVEIFDILACGKGQDIGASIDEIMASGQGDVVLIMLLDVNSFWRYDNRESLMQKT